MHESDAKMARTQGPGQREDAETFTVQQLRAMEQPKWNEGRLDDLNKRVDSGIGRLDGERKELRGEVREGFKGLDKRFEKVDDEFKAVRSEMSAGFKAVDKRFEKVDDEFKAVRSEMSAGFKAVDRRFEKVDDEFKAVRSEMSAGFDRLFWKLVGMGFSGAAAVFAMAEFLA
jgi:chromosome segregation ATPase